MRKEHCLWNQITEHSFHSTGTALFQSIIEVVGDHRVLIENHHGVITYGKEKVIANVRYGTVCICGSTLEITHMTREHLIIQGNIHSISLHRRN